MNHDGLLDKKGNRNNRQYKLMETVDEGIASQHNYQRNYQRQTSYEKKRAESR
jgi:hypothetical protein